MTEDLKATVSTLESRLQEAERRAEELCDALKPFAGLGGGPELQAYADLEDDVIVFKCSGHAVTAGDVRNAREKLAAALDEPVSMTHFRRRPTVLEQENIALEARACTAERQLADLRAENARLRALVLAADGCLVDAPAIAVEERNRALKAESERDTLTQQVAGLEKVLRDVQQYLRSGSWRNHDGVDKIISQALASSTPSPLMALVEAGNRLLGTLRTSSEDCTANGIVQINWPTLAEASDFSEAWREYRKAYTSIIEKEKGIAHDTK